METNVIVTLLISLALTVAFELALCLVCKVRAAHDIILVVLVNVLTNPPVVLTHNIIKLNTSFSPVLIVIFLEAMVIVIEGFCYKYCSKQILRPFLLSFAANAVSYLSGLLILKLI